MNKKMNPKKWKEAEGDCTKCRWAPMLCVKGGDCHFEPKLDKSEEGKDISYVNAIQRIVQEPGAIWDGLSLKQIRKLARRLIEAGIHRPFKDEEIDGIRIIKEEPKPCTCEEPSPAGMLRKGRPFCLECDKDILCKCKKRDVYYNEMPGDYVCKKCGLIAPKQEWCECKKPASCAFGPGRCLKCNKPIKHPRAYEPTPTELRIRERF